MKNIKYACMCIFVSTLFHSQALAKATFARPVMIKTGAVQGIRENGLTVYKGIPFARPPLGDLRWKAPQAVEAWADIRQATVFAPACIQVGEFVPGKTQADVSEDCLYLNIWAKANTTQSNLPVIVWIHGGAYERESASIPLYHGDRLAHKGVIVVTIAYRLGPFGFLAHPELTRESPHKSSGNYGLMDQIAALEWVHSNIAAFGGDPTRVTIAGQSSGSISVSALMASPLAKGLFQRAIGQSGGLFEPLQLAPDYLLANAERNGEKFFTSRGVSTIAELRQLPVAKLVEGNIKPVSHPVMEPYVLPRSPYEVFASGEQNDVPILVGANTDEASSLIDVTKVKAATLAADLTRSYGQFSVPLLAVYPYTNDAEARQARLGLERDLRFGWDMWTWARLASSGKNPVYYYAFDQRPPFPSGSAYEGWGASHYAELWYMFDHLDQERWKWTKADRRLAHEMSSYWANFARSGNPNGKRLPTWPAYVGTDSNVMYLGDPSRVAGVPSIKALNVFDSIYNGIRGK